MGPEDVSQGGNSQKEDERCQKSTGREEGE